MSKLWKMTAAAMFVMAIALTGCESPAENAANNMENAAQELAE